MRFHIERLYRTACIGDWGVYSGGGSNSKTGCEEIWYIEIYRTYGSKNRKWLSGKVVWVMPYEHNRSSHFIASNICGSVIHRQS